MTPREEVTMDNNTTPEQEVNVFDEVKTYSDHGFLTTPVTPGKKKTPAWGTTGRQFTPEEKRVNAPAAWETAPSNANVALSLLPGQFALDVDHYEDGSKQGWIHLQELFAEHGLNIDDYPWDEWPRSTRRGVDSAGAQFFFRVPEDLEYLANPCEDVEIVQATHRYSLVWPSVVDGMQYHWYKGDKKTGIPFDDGLPELPAEWIPVFSRGPVRSAGCRVDEESLNASLAWLESRVFGGESQAELPDDVHRYDPMRDTVMSLVTNAVHYGHAGLMEALKEIKERRVAYELEARGVVSDDYAGAVTSAVAKVKAEIASSLKPDINWREKFGAEPLFDDYAALPDFWDLLAGAAKKQAEAYLAELIEEEQTAESLEERRAAAVAAVEASAPEDYWQTQPNLAKIAHYAERLSVDKYSLLFRVFAYLSAQMPPTTYLKGTTDQPLTIYSVVIAESGRGKGYLDELADTLVGEHLRGPEKQTVLRHGTGNMHTLLTELGDFQAEVKDQEDIPIPQRLLIQGNELASWAEMQGNLQWTGILADVFDGEGKYHVRNAGHKYSFKIDQHSLAVTFSVQPDAAHYLFDSTGRGLPGRCLISALPPIERTLPEDYDPFDLSVDYGIKPFNIKEDTEPLRFNPAYMHNDTPFYLSAQAEQVNANLKEAWDQEIGEYKRLRAEKIFSQMPKVRLRVAALLKVLLDLGEGHEVPLEALKMADFLLKVSVENTRYARALAETAERQGSAAVAAVRKRADADADLSLAKENVLAVIDKSKSGKAGLERINDRKKKTAADHPAAIAELVAEGVLEVIKTEDGRVSYRRQ